MEFIRGFVKVYKIIVLIEYLRGRGVVKVYLYSTLTITLFTFNPPILKVLH